MRQVSSSHSSLLSCHFLVCCTLPCHHLHFICMFFKLASGLFHHCPFRNLTLPHAPTAPLLSCFMSGRKKRSHNGSGFVKWPWYITGRPPVKFRSIWRSFDAPMVNRVTAKAPVDLQPNTPPNQPTNPAKPPPCSPSLEDDRVGENRTPFGLS